MLLYPAMRQLIIRWQVSGRLYKDSLPVDFFKNCPSADTCFAVSQLFNTAKTSMFLSQSTEQNKVLYPEMNAQL